MLHTVVCVTRGAENPRGCLGYKRGSSQPSRAPHEALLLHRHVTCTVSLRPTTVQERAQEAGNTQTERAVDNDKNKSSQVQVQLHILSTRAVLCTPCPVPGDSRWSAPRVCTRVESNRGLGVFKSSSSPHGPVPAHVQFDSELAYELVSRDHTAVPGKERA